MRVAQSDVWFCGVMLLKGGHTKRRLAFAILLTVAVLALTVGVIRGNPETIHRFAAQI
ncbi:MAG TPA: hypothetical protein VMH22_10695 [bacterium]|nr:hypothetical protein [bacterium]